MQIVEAISRYTLITAIIATIAYLIFAFIEHEKAVKDYRESTKKYKEAVEDYKQAVEEYKVFTKKLGEIIKTEVNQNDK